MKNKVYLVGAGPGDINLITVKGKKLIEKADVLIYDRLANKKFLQYKKDDCELYYVGKASSNHTLTQDEINKLIVNKAKENLLVVRLKGGDPYVFGRGAEEGEFLLKNDLDFEVVPGITSAIGGLAYAGIPITHRDFASSFHVFTGHFKSDDRDHNWDAIALLKGTLVFLMGLSNVKNICSNLESYGKSKETPVAIISNATRTNQEIIRGTIENISEVLAKSSIVSPALLVVGDVVNLSKILSSPLDGKLRGKKIIVTRSRKQSSSLTSSLESFGANVIEMPAIKIKKILKENEFKIHINELSKITHIIFTSVNGVEIYFEELLKNNYDARKLAGIKIVAIGSSTRNKLKQYGIIADIMPKKFVAEEVFKSIKGTIDSSSYVVLPRAKGSRKYLLDEISSICKTKEILLYESIKDEELIKTDISEVENTDYITFTSSSTVKNFIESFDTKSVDLINTKKIISIGPITSATLKEYGVNNVIEADEYTIDGIIDVLLKDNEVKNV
ncbi:uroporphyrinogen-III C-methyltransferase [Helicovermis profundi]|uniref:uroporphyrinogen-III C-methyltransferase n=1 Tax=Helicovermis profundi TaxID=3065157 RepID=A0AAU9EQH9_9FIRM|nr:uroporphyrinogen-III C-methyltransferase [Clostridia bacterium S502]